ncbi:hypothetical protein HDU93_007525 [Gonapodya sp. JEL0774]|nr:hypothetical protein HDU93_007525 [Gonapodya sp. JEL0774]
MAPVSLPQAAFGPPLDGEITLDAPGLREPFHIIRDSLGVPHVRAKSFADAFFAQAFATAQDRLFQMDLARRVILGRTAELLGEGGPVERDMMMRRMGMGEGCKRDWEATKKDKRTREMLEAYTAGVNAFMSTQPLPAEYTLLGVEPEPWQPFHCIAASKARHVYAGTVAAKLARSKLFAKLPREIAVRLVQEGRSTTPGDKTIIPTGGEWNVSGEVLAAIEGGLDAVREMVEAAAGAGTGTGGSNSWILDGRFTETGKPVLCGDPHREVENPTMFYEIHVECPEFDIIGYTFSGSPGFPHFGHSKHLAWTITHAMADKEDLFIEKTTVGTDGHPTYLFRNSQLPLVVHDEPILVLNHKTRKIESHPHRVYSSHHGGILIGDPTKDEYCVSFANTSNDPRRENKQYLCHSRLLTARTVDEAVEAMREWVEPQGNFGMVDLQGNIGYVNRGRQPIRSFENLYGPVPGWDGEHEWKGYIPYEEMPRLINPPSGIIVHANQPIIGVSYKYHPLSIDYAPAHRASRIHTLLTEILSSRKYQQSDTAKITADTVSLVAPIFVQLAQDIPANLLGRDEQIAREMLIGWDKDCDRHSPAASIYQSFRRMLWTSLLRRGPLAPLNAPNPLGKLSEGPHSMMRGATPVITLSNALTSALRKRATFVLDGPEDSWVKRGIEALTAAVAELKTLFPDESDFSEWRWGRLHKVKPHHPLSGTFPEIATELDAPAFEMGGDGDTVQAAGVASNYLVSMLSGQVAILSTNTSEINDLRDLEVLSCDDPPLDESHDLETDHVSSLNGLRGVEEALAAWQKIDLPLLQRELDSKGITMSEIPSENNNARKKLSDLTKDFRKVPDEEKLPKFLPLLKAYQSEIDNFAKRSLVAHAAFLDLYRIFSEAPDPVPIMVAFLSQSARIQTTQSLELDIKRFKSELENALTQLAHARKEASDVGVLREKIAKQESKFNEMVAKQVADRELALEKDYEDRIAAMKEREDYLTRQFEHISSQHTHLRATHTAAQSRLLDLTQKTSEESAARAAEMEMVAQELDTVRARLERSEEERRRLVLRVKELESGEEVSDDDSVPRRMFQKRPNTDAAVKSEFDSEDKVPDFETSASPSVALLLSDLDRLRSENAQSERVLRDRITELECDLEVAKSECEKLRPLIGVGLELETAKRELDVLKMVEFGDTYEKPTENPPVSPTQSLPRSLERLLLEKNRRIQNELADHKMRLETALSDLSDTIRDRDEATARSDKLQSLVVKLEEDLERVSAGVGDPVWTSVKGRDSLGGLVPNEEVLADVLENVSSRLQSDEARLPHGALMDRSASESGRQPSSQTTSTIVPILTGQRDRYRKKNSELEEQNRSLMSKVAQLQRTIDQLKDDNVKLYERMRFLQSYASVSETSPPLGNFDQSTSRISSEENNFALVSDTSVNTRIDIPVSGGNRKGYAAQKSTANSPLGSLRTFGPDSGALHLFVFALIAAEMMRVECRHDLCPYSAKAYLRWVNDIQPVIEAKYPGKIQFLFRHQVQPWHPQSTLTHEAALAVEKVDPLKFHAFSKLLFERQVEFFDLNIQNLSRDQVYARLVEIAKTVGVDSEKVAALLRLKSGEGVHFNTGNSVTEDRA